MNEQVLSALETDIQLAETISDRQTDHKEQVFTAVLTAILLNRSFETHAVTAPAAKRAPKALTASEFFARLRPAQDVDKVLGAAYFLETYRNASNFTSDELRRCLLDAKVKPPANVSLAILYNAKKGLLAQTGKKEGGKISWFLTQTGTEAVEQMIHSRAKGPVKKQDSKGEE